MKAIRLHGRGGPEAFAYEEAPQPQPDEGEVLVRVAAAAVTPTELAWAPTWTTPTGEPRPFPIILGHEFSGEVAAVGRGVTDLAVGDFVYGLNDWYRDGAQAEFCTARATEVALKPRSVDHLAAAVTPISALTAWQGLIERGRLARGQRVLIHGAAGAVGVFAVQIAHWRGAQVIGTASAHNGAFVRSLGADEVIDYRARRFEDVVRDVDLVFDTVGGETFERSWGVVKPGGRVVTIAAAGETSHDPRTREAFFIVEANRTQLAEIARLIDTGQLRPVVDAVFPLAEARQAYEHKPTHGKVVLRIADEGSRGEVRRRRGARMKSLNVQLQPSRSPDLDVEAALVRLQAVAPATVSRGNDDGPYINVNFHAADLRPLWLELRELLRQDAKLAECTIVCCHGEHGWDDYLLLHHFDSSEPLDRLE